MKNEQDDFQRLDEQLEEVIQRARELSDEYDVRYLTGHDLLVLGQGRIGSIKNKRRKEQEEEKVK